MTENEINITDMIKALQCVASQDADGDCYCDHFNAHLTCEQFGDNARLDEKHMSCGGILKDTQSCPYSQKTYGVCYEDGELWWLKDIVSILEEIQQYRAIGTIEEFKALKEKEERFDRNIKMYNKIGLEIRANAIDEFVKSEDYLMDKIKEETADVNIDFEWRKVVCLDDIRRMLHQGLCEIAEQLKAGGKNE